MGNDRCLGARHLSKLPLWLPHFIGADYLWGQKGNFSCKITFLLSKKFFSFYNARAEVVILIGVSVSHRDTNHFRKFNK